MTSGESNGERDCPCQQSTKQVSHSFIDGRTAPLGAGHRQRILKTGCSVEGSVVVRSIRLSTVSILILLLMQGASPAFSFAAEASPSARGGTNDDFVVTDIQISNSSFTPSMWYQGDGTAVEYVFKGEAVPITMTIKRSGSSFNPAKAEVLLEVVHPIGFVSWSTNWTTPDTVSYTHLTLPTTPYV